MRFGWLEIVLILVIVLVVFGVGKLPQIGSSLGKGIRDFRRESRGESDKEDTRSV
jgi:sec-independent protein translocase protein TatA